MNKRIRLHHIISLLLGFLITSTTIAAGSIEKESLEESTPPGIEDVKATEKAQKNEAAEEAEPEDNGNKKDEKDKKNQKDKDGKDKKDKDEKKKGEPPKKAAIIFAGGDSEFKFSVRLRMPEFFYGKNLRLLNDENPTDRVVFFRHTIDLNAEYRYGKPTTEYDLAYFKMTIRNRGIWGDPESIASTTLSPIRELDAVFGEHRHGLPRHVLWIRGIMVTAFGK